MGSIICGGGPPHACAVMPWGGGTYFMLGVGGCNYDASSVAYHLFLLCFPPRPSSDLLYSHMLYICRY
jgi:hypothetical protein